MDAEAIAIAVMDQQHRERKAERLGQMGEDEYSSEGAGSPVAPKPPRLGFADMEKSSRATLTHSRVSLMYHCFLSCIPYRNIDMYRSEKSQQSPSHASL